MFKVDEKMERSINSIYITMDYQLFIIQHGDLIIMDNNEIPLLVEKLNKVYSKWLDYKHNRYCQQRLKPVVDEIEKDFKNEEEKI